MNRRDLLKAGAAGVAGSMLSPDDILGAPRKKGEPRLVVRRASERGRANHGWLDTRHTFSFARYHDPKHTHFRGLRVINEDRVRPGKGFGMHPHEDMEIITYVLSGSLRHRDSLGNGSVIVPGEVQRMSAGKGIRHSEYNPSKDKDVHFLQIWIFPEHKGVKPSYAQRTFSAKDRTNRLRRVASPTGSDGSISINADANLYAGILHAKKSVTYTNPKGRHVWLQVARGELAVNGTKVAAGDGVRTSDAGKLVLETGERKGAEVLLFDLA